LFPCHPFHPMQPVHCCRTEAIRRQCSPSFSTNHVITFTVCKFLPILSFRLVHLAEIVRRTRITCYLLRFLLCDSKSASKKSGYDERQVFPGKWHELLELAFHRDKSSCTSFFLRTEYTSLKLCTLVN